MHGERALNQPGLWEAESTSWGWSPQGMVWFGGARMLCGDSSADQGAPGLSPTLVT